MSNPITPNDTISAALLLVDVMEQRASGEVLWLDLPDAWEVVGADDHGLDLLSMVVRAGFARFADEPGPLGLNKTVQRIGLTIPSGAYGRLNHLRAVKRAHQDIDL